jgi:thiosulfate/3-mercaptopyruvate sulfurtransferase
MAERRPRQWRRRLFFLALILGGGLTLAVAQRLAHGVPQGGYAQPGFLIQAEDLKALVDQGDPQVRIIDVRHKAKYYLGHIPGAIQVWRPDLEDKKQGLPGMPASGAQLEKLLGRLGIGRKNTLVIYSNQCDHTRLWWLLAYWGFPLEQMKLLDGGIEAWKAKGYPTQLTGPRLKRATFRLPAVPQRPSLVASLEEVRAAAQDPRKVIVDVRPSRQYLGQETKEGAVRTGHIPEAVSVDWHETKLGQGPYKGYWKGAAEIKKLFEAKGVSPDKDIYLYGHIALCSSCALASLYLAGYPLEKLHLYAGSWVEWSRSKEPIKGPVMPARPPKKAKAK